MRPWRGVVTTLVALGVTIALVQLLPSSARDFPPFLMTIEEWNSARVGYADGRTLGGTAVYRLEYHRRDDWTLTLVSDDVVPQVPGQGSACRKGTYGHLDAQGRFTVTSTDPAMCNGVGRWVHYGVARSYAWEKEVRGDVVIYTDPGERVVFDLATGLPLLYEAGPVGGPVGSRDVYRL